MTTLEAIKAFTSYIDVPTLILLGMLGFAWSIVHKAQKREDFDFGNMLKDESGKESAHRLTAIGSFAVSTWYIMYYGMHVTNPDPVIFGIYVGAWSGTAVAMKFGDALIAKWSK